MPQLIDTIRRQEVDVLLSTQNNILNTAHEIKSFITDVQSKADVILNNQARTPTAQVCSNRIIKRMAESKN